jgi:isocitrate dehydrogenase (NAD+)
LAVVPSVVVLHGDRTGEELLRQALRLLDRDLIGAEVDLRHFDLSLTRRRETRNQVVLEAAGSLRGLELAGGRRAVGRRSAA